MRRKALPEPPRPATAPAQAASTPPADPTSDHERDTQPTYRHDQANAQSDTQRSPSRYEGQETNRQPSDEPTTPHARTQHDQHRLRPLGAGGYWRATEGQGDVQMEGVWPRSEPSAPTATSPGPPSVTPRMTWPPDSCAAASISVARLQAVPSSDVQTTGSSAASIRLQPTATSPARPLIRRADACFPRPDRATARRTRGSTPTRQETSRPRLACPARAGGRPGSKDHPQTSPRRRCRSRRGHVQLRPRPRRTPARQRSRPGYRRFRTRHRTRRGHAARASRSRRRVRERPCRCGSGQSPTGLPAWN